MGISWKAVVWSGLLAGLVGMVLQMLFAALFLDQSIWTQPRLLATMVLGAGAGPPPAGFEFAPVAVGLTVHFLLSLLVALVLGALISLTGADFVWSVIGGATFGLIVYIVGYYGFTVAFPALHGVRSGATLFNHIVYGAMLAGLYRGISAPVEVPPTE